MIRKGDPVTIKAQWRDPGDNFKYVASSDESSDRVDIVAVDSGLQFPPINTVCVKMLEGGA